MRQVTISNRDLLIMVKVDGMTADQIAAKLSMENNTHINGEDVVELIKSRGIQQKNIKRSTNYVFVNPEDMPLVEANDESMMAVMAVAETQEMVEHGN